MIYLRCNCCNFYTLLVCKITKKYDKQSNEIQNFTYGGGDFFTFYRYFNYAEEDIVFVRLSRPWSDGKGPVCFKP